MYPRSKLLAELAVQDFIAKDKRDSNNNNSSIDVTIVRPRYAPQEFSLFIDMKSVVPRFIWGRGDTTVLPAFADAVKSGVFKWFNGGTYRTSTCHVRNVCEGMVCAAER